MVRVIPVEFDSISNVRTCARLNRTTTALAVYRFEACTNYQIGSCTHRTLGSLIRSLWYSYYDSGLSPISITVGFSSFDFYAFTFLWNWRVLHSLDDTILPLFFDLEVQRMQSFNTSSRNLLPLYFMGEFRKIRRLVVNSHQLSARAFNAFCMWFHCM